MLRPVTYGLLLTITLFFEVQVLAQSSLKLVQAPVKAEVASSAPWADKLDKLLKHYETNHKFMGSVAVFSEGKPVFDGQYGLMLADQKTGPEPNRDTQYRIGSITKMFTAVMVLQLVEAGKLNLTTKLSEFFPKLKNADSITMAHLLGHRSGLGSVTDDPLYSQWHTQKQTRATMMERIAEQASRFEPNAKTEYSNTNYILLGYIIEEIAGQSYADELQRQIVKPLGLQRTEYAIHSNPIKNVAASFSRTRGTWQRAQETDPSVPHGAGAIISTPTDLCVFIEALFGDKLISQESLTKMSTMQEDMGLGMTQFPFGSKRALGHNGAIDEFLASLAHFPTEKLSIAVTGNGCDCSLNEIMIALLTIAFGGDARLPSFEKIEVANEVLKGYEGVYASAAIPLKISVKLTAGELTAQATGQSAFPLTPNSDVQFEYLPAGIVVSFSKSKPTSGFDSLELSQAGQTVRFTKE